MNMCRAVFQYGSVGTASMAIQNLVCSQIRDRIRWIGEKQNEHVQAFFQDGSVDLSQHGHISARGKQSQIK